jgi:short-subunit dehydrogenase
MAGRDVPSDDKGRLMQLTGKRMWLIGASSGIGAALAPDLVAQGVVLAISSRNETELNNVAGKAARFGMRPLVKPLDVTDAASLQRVHDELVAEWGRIDVLFYNSGVWLPVRVEDFDAENAARQVEVNLTGMMRAVGTVVSEMVAKRDGEIIGMASLAGYRGYPKAAAYSSSKAGAIAFLQSIRMDLKRYEVGVTTINPGFVRTPLAGLESKAPFVIDADKASRMIVKGLLNGDTEIHFPRRLSWPLKLITALPSPIYERLARLAMSRG